MTPPTAADAQRIAEHVLAEPVASVERFTTGAANWVYDVTTRSGARAVVRITRSHNACAGGAYWSRTLRPLGVPLPRMIAHHVGNGDGERSWMVLERLPGTDLEHAYRSLGRTQKLDVLDRVMRAQAIVQAMPVGPRFGFTDGLEPPKQGGWLEVLLDHLDRSRRQIRRVGVVDPARADRVQSYVMREDFSDVAPVPFLDDTTERNVIVHEGEFQGIVDVDGLCYGDPLLVPALTRMALLNQGGDTLYTDAWVDRLRLSETGRRHFQLYTAMFAVNFLAEQGQQFNRDAPPGVDPRAVERLEAILDRLLTGL